MENPDFDVFWFFHNVQNVLFSQKAGCGQDFMKQKTG